MSRPILYAVSDLHAQTPIEPYLFTARKEERLAAVISEVRECGATLLVAGDAFDLTGMTPPRRGLDDFFRAMGVGSAPPTATSDVTEQLEALARTFPGLFESLGSLARKDRLKLMLGNHDFAMCSPGGRATIAAALGIPDAAAVLAGPYRAAGFLFATHGNEYDASNVTTRGWRNRGSVITAALYQAIIPLLDSVGLSHIGDALPAVRPEENVVDGLELYLGMQRTHDLLVAFVELLRDNGYFTGWAQLKAWFGTHLLAFALTPKSVRSALADDTRLSDLVRSRAEALLKDADFVSPGAPPPQVVVMGHTHVWDGSDGYVNLGTWVDHVSGLAKDQLEQADLTLPVLVVCDDGTAALHDCNAPARVVRDCPILWQRTAHGADRLLTTSGSAGLMKMTSEVFRHSNRWIT